MESGYLSNYDREKIISHKTANAGIYYYPVFQNGIVVNCANGLADHKIEFKDKPISTNLLASVGAAAAIVPRASSRL